MEGEQRKFCYFGDMCKHINNSEHNDKYFHSVIGTECPHGIKCSFIHNITHNVLYTHGGIIRHPVILYNSCDDAIIKIRGKYAILAALKSIVKDACSNCPEIVVETISIISKVEKNINEEMEKIKFDINASI
jgi:hypothetical protein